MHKNQNGWSALDAMVIIAIASSLFLVFGEMFVIWHFINKFW